MGIKNTKIAVLYPGAKRLGCQNNNGGLLFCVLVCVGGGGGVCLRHSFIYYINNNDLLYKGNSAKSFIIVMRTLEVIKN